MNPSPPSHSLCWPPPLPPCQPLSGGRGANDRRGPHCRAGRQRSRSEDRSGFLLTSDLPISRMSVHFKAAARVHRRVRPPRRGEQALRPPCRRPPGAPAAPKVSGRSLHRYALQHSTGDAAARSPRPAKATSARATRTREVAARSGSGEGVGARRQGRRVAVHGALTMRSRLRRARPLHHESCEREKSSAPGLADDRC